MVKSSKTFGSINVPNSTPPSDIMFTKTRIEMNQNKVEEQDGMDFGSSGKQSELYYISGRNLKSEKCQ